MKFTISNIISVDRKDMPGLVRAECERRLCFTNPKWSENERQGRWQGETPRTLRYMDLETDVVEIPRGFIRQFLKILRYNDVSFTIQDRTRCLREVPFEFKGELYPFQEDAVEAVLSRRYGVLNSPTGSGKTVIAFYAIAKRKQPALIICHTKQLLYQWQDRACEFLDIEKDEIGLIGDGHKTLRDRLTIGIVNTAYKMADELRKHTGFLVVDECHRCPSRTFTEAVGVFDSRYLLGLSATPYRRDGLGKVIFFYLGDQVFSIDPKTLQEQRHIMKPQLIVIETGVSYSYADDYQEMIGVLVDSSYRNRLIARTVVKEVENGTGVALVLSDRVRHVEMLNSMLSASGAEVRMLTGRLSNKERKAVVEKLQDGKVRVLVATAQLVGEGFDLKELSSIFLVTPVKFSGRVLQYVGRILRVAEGKSAPKIFDFVDDVGVLQASFKARCHAYKKLGVIVEEI